MVNLHELHGIKRQAVPDKRTDSRKADRLGKEPLQPEEKVPSDDGLYRVFIYGWIRFTDSITVGAIRISADDSMLVSKGYSVVGNDGGKQKGMGLPALGAFHAADTQRNSTVRKENAPFIVGMNRKASRVAAGTCQPVKLETVYNGIVIIL